MSPRNLLYLVPRFGIPPFGVRYERLPLSPIKTVVQYVKGALALMLSSRFPAAEKVRAAVNVGGGRFRGFRLLVSSAGKLKLPHSGGQSAFYSLFRFSFNFFPDQVYRRVPR